MLNDAEKKELSKIISELVQNGLPENNQNLYEKIELMIDKTIKNHNKTIINKAVELIDSKRINLPNIEDNYQEPIEVDMIKANKNNPHSFIKNQNELQKYNEGLSDAVAVLSELQ